MSDQLNNPEKDGKNNADLQQVLMPYSTQRRFMVMQECWAELKLQIQSSTHDNEGIIFKQLRNCLATYNPKLLQYGNFNILEDLCNFIANEKCEQFCLRQLLLGIIELAQELYSQFSQPIIPLLCQNVPNYVRINKSLAASLLANAFLCAFPKREGPGLRAKNNTTTSGHFASYPRINFNELYDDTLNSIDDHSWRGRARMAKLEKLKCLMNYFKRTIEGRELGLSPSENDNEIIFERKVLSPEEFFDWEGCKEGLLKVEAFNEGAIEHAEGRLQVDFANEFVGGGTLGNGSAMEEIRFVTCPELIIAQLFTERLDHHESLVVNGFEQYSTYTGYGSSFQFGGDYEQDANTSHQLVVLDALRFPRNSRAIQYTKENMERELHKCLVGFRSSKNDHIPPTPVPIVASGKWGCGVFNGEPELKSMLQWMATSMSNKDLELYTFGDHDLTQKINELAEIVAQNHEITVGFMYRAVTKFGKSLQTRDDRSRRQSTRPRNHFKARSLIDFLKLEIVSRKRLQYSSSSSGSGGSCDEDNKGMVHTRTRKIQPQPPKTCQFSPTSGETVSSTYSTSSLIVPAKSDSWIERNWIFSNICCMLQKVIPIIKVWAWWVVVVVAHKIPGVNWLVSIFQKIFFPPIHYFVTFCWKRVVDWIVMPGLGMVFRMLDFAWQKTNKMINYYRNPQAASFPTRSNKGGGEKEELDLSDSD